MLKIRRPLGRLIFNMGIAIPGKTVFLIETAPRICVKHGVSSHTKRNRARIDMIWDYTIVRVLCCIVSKQNTNLAIHQIDTVLIYDNLRSNIKERLSWYRHSHHMNDTFITTSYLYKGNLYIDQMVFLYWDVPVLFSWLWATTLCIHIRRSRSNTVKITRYNM